MWGGFPKVVQSVFPNALLVFDRFHVMQLVNKELNQVRQQTETSLKGGKFILLKNGIDLTQSERVKLEVILNSSQRLRLAYNFKEEFREIFETCKTVKSGQERLLDWLGRARSVYGNVLTIIRNHLQGICNYFLSRTTSGVMEGINNRIKLIKRQGYGFVNFDNFRSRLLACFSH